VTVQARAEFTNIFNRIRPPNPTSTNALAPQLPAASDAAVATGFGSIAWTGTPTAPVGAARQGQVVLRLTF